MFPNKLFITFAFSKNNGNMTAIRHLGYGLQIQGKVVIHFVFSGRSSRQQLIKSVIYDSLSV